MKEMLHGSCLCGVIKYEVDISNETSLTTSLCHCRVCRKITSATTSLNLAVAYSSFKLIEGVLKTIKMKHLDDGFYMTLSFCGQCGSAIHAEAEMGEASPKAYIVQMGTLDDIGPLEFLPSIELNIKHRLNWLQCIEGAEQRKGYAE